jgi:hypothetical protein
METYTARKEFFELLDAVRYFGYFRTKPMKNKDCTFTINYHIFIKASL